MYIVFLFVYNLQKFEHSSNILYKPQKKYDKISRIQPQHKECYINLFKSTGYVMHHQFNIQQLYALPTLYVFCISLRTNRALCYLSINWLVFITEMKSVYSAVRTGSLNKAICVSSLKG
jgi:hypothetical protein